MVKTMMNNNILGLPDFESMTVVLSGKRNFREDLYPDYKANRAAVPKPRHFSDVRAYLVRNYGAVVTDGHEADDELGTMAMKLRKEKKPYIVASTDKDLKQIPGEHYDFAKGESWSVSERDALKFFYEQLLSGDATDNIPGIDGIGPKKAEAALAGCTTPRECAEVAYSHYSKFLGKVPDEIIDRNATLLWIWRKQGDKHPFWKHLGREPI